ncbi:phage terminase small subunit P27 family [Virgibacillus sp. AGTR]|uniref:phage terminase small subunit P27 family n=1 Tax=Virgibacillus sp. AGTR TaxID=2812055 RepID=UPI001D16D43B|nr:phage terminase small subunit P27 family [Virgibacillus sp. AGTR]MCC2248846.1 phage terminase small subunit P27 family [Virgibacillus sp. AGTR]
MRGKPSRGLYSEEELKKHKKGKDHIAKELAKQDTLNDYDQLQVKPIPSHLDYYGKQEWKRIIPLLQQLPIAELDRQMIESYCQLHGYKRRLQKDIQEFGEVTNFYDDKGNLTNRRINPSYNAYLSTVKEIRMIANQLGMTINSRLQLAIPEQEKEEDEILKLLKG